MKSTIVLTLAILSILLYFDDCEAHRYYEWEAPTGFTQPTSETFSASYGGALSSLVWETSTGYTIVMNYSDGFWYYATLDGNGEFTPSAYKVAIDDAPSSALHLRRSAARLAAIEDEMDDEADLIDGALVDYRAIPRDDPVEYIIAVLCVDYDTDVNYGRHESGTQNHGGGQINVIPDHFDQPYLMDLIASENSFTSQNEYLTTGGYSAHGSLRDWFDETTNGEVLFVPAEFDAHAAEGEYPAVPARDLLVNPYDNGESEITWLTFPDTACIPHVRFDIVTILDSAMDRNWIELDENGYPGFDRLVVYLNHYAECTIANIDGLDLNGEEFLKDPALNGRKGLWATKANERDWKWGLYDELALLNLPVHEMCHTLGFSHSRIGDYYLRSWYVNGNAVHPYGGYPELRSRTSGLCPMGTGSFNTNGTARTNNPWGFGAGNSNPSLNIVDRVVMGWIGDSTAITEDDEIVLSYSASSPNVYYFPYKSAQNATDTYWDTFILEVKQCLFDDENEGDDWTDNNSLMPGHVDWDHVGWGQTQVPQKTNLVIWHTEIGWRIPNGDPFDFAHDNFSFWNIKRSIRFADGHAWITDAYEDQPVLVSADTIAPYSKIDWDAYMSANGNDYFPQPTVDEFGPGTYDNVDMRLDYSSRDGYDEVATELRSLQTGFCLKNITVDDEEGTITMDAYTNYWGGDVTEDLTLEGTNIYLGQDCEIQEGASITITSENDDCTVNLDSDVTNWCGSMTFDPGDNNCEVNLNDFSCFINGTNGGDVEFNEGNGQISFVGPGDVFTDFTGDIRIDNTNVEFTGTGWDLTIGVDSEWHVGNDGVLRFENTGEDECTVFLLDDLVLEGEGHLIVLQINGDITFRGPGQLIIQDDAEFDIEGTSNAHIVFTSGEDIPARGDCGGIVFEDATVSHTLSYVDIEYASIGITVDNCGSYISMDNVTITDFKDYGFQLISSSPTMDNCSASNSTPSGTIYPVGLSSYNSSPDITNSDFDNNYVGIKVNGSSGTFEMGTSSASDNASDGSFFYDSYAYLYYNAMTPDNGYNSFIGNGDEGVSAGGFAGVYMGNGSYSPGNNSIYDNYAYDLANYTAYTIMAEYNWWDDVLGPSNNYGYVDSSPFLTSAPGSFAPVDNGDHFVDGVDDDVDDLLQYADSLFDSGNINDALAAYQAILADYPDDARILNTVRRTRDCYKGLDRNGDWRQYLQALNQNQRLRAQARPMLVSLRANDMMENGEIDDARTLLQGALRNLNAEDATYPSLLFQLGMLYHYSLDDPMAAAEVFNRFMNSFGEHPLYRSAAVEYAACIEEEDIDSPGQPENMVDLVLPTEFGLYPPYPNPFNDVVIIRFAVPQTGQINIALFDVLGRKVQDVVDLQYKAGIHDVQVSGHNLDSGVYFCQMTAFKFEQTRKLIYVK